MNLKKRAELAVKDIAKIVGGELSADQRDALDKVIGDLMADALRACASSTTEAATACCPEDRDMAHKIAQEVKLAQIALVANLSSLR